MIGRVSEHLVWAYRETRAKVEADLKRAREARDSAEVQRLTKALRDLDDDRRASGIPR